MPCRCDYPDDPPAPDPNLKRLKNLADKATRAACDMRTIIRRHAPNILDELTPETLQWILKHDKEDEKRIAEENAKGIREQTRLNALNKLTIEERRVLGL
jgi:hypothetical protein